MAYYSVRLKSTNWENNPKWLCLTNEMACFRDGWKNSSSSCHLHPNWVHGLGFWFSGEKCRASLLVGLQALAARRASIITFSQVSMRFHLLCSAISSYLFSTSAFLFLSFGVKMNGILLPISDMVQLVWGFYRTSRRGSEGEVCCGFLMSSTHVLTKVGQIVDDMNVYVYVFSETWRGGLN